MSVSVRSAQRAACDRGDRANLHQLRAGQDLCVAALLCKEAHAMTLLAPGTISITDGAIVIAAETVAPRLGLKPDALQAEMQRGKVCCVLETGVDEDEGRTRVTVRYHARSWTLVIEPDGKERATAWSASAIPMKTRPTSSHRDQIAEQLRTCLQNMAAAGLTITYGGLARLLGLLPPNTIHQITVALERLMEEDAGAGRPFITALVRSEERRVGKEGK